MSETYRDDEDAGTVDDWFGQNVAEDQEVADQAVEDAKGDLEKAEELYEERAKGEEHYEETHPRPDGEA
jgi:hypothetical protein